MISTRQAQTHLSRAKQYSEKAAYHHDQAFRALAASPSSTKSNAKKVTKTKVTDKKTKRGRPKKSV